MPETSPAVVAALLASGVALGGVVALLAMSSGKSSRRRRRLVAFEDDDDDDDETTAGAGARPRGRKSKLEVPEDEMMGMYAGFSMAQAREMADVGHEAAKNKTPYEVLSDLQKGNTRFWMGTAHRPESSAFERRALISKQFPLTAILSCSDSRVPIEIVFDQGLGDMFVIRVAGNCLDTATTASLQYAVNHLKVKVLVVMGHEGCGAIKAAQLPAEAIAKEPECLGTLLNNLKRGLNSEQLSHIKDSRAHDREAVTANVKKQVEALVRDPGMMAKVRSGELLCCGAFYEISSGIVDFFHEVSRDAGPPPSSPKARGHIQRQPSRGVMTRHDVP